MSLPFFSKGMMPLFLNPNPIHTDIADWGVRFINSKYARPYRHKSRKALTNFRSGNKKKIRQFVK